MSILENNVFDNLDQATSGRGKSLFDKHTPVGTSYTGTIKSVTQMQANDIKTEKPAFWDNGDPKLQFGIRLYVPALVGALGPDDDGSRTCYIKGWGLQASALADAIRASGLGKASQALAPGNQFTATFTGFGEQSKAGYNPPRLYQYAIQPGTNPDVAGTLDQLTNQPAPQQQAPVAQQAPQPAVPAWPPATETTPAGQSQFAETHADRLAVVHTLAHTGMSVEKIGETIGLDPATVTTLLAQPQTN